MELYRLVVINRVNPTAYDVATFCGVVPSRCFLTESLHLLVTDVHQELVGLTPVGPLTGHAAIEEHSVCIESHIPLGASLLQFIF